MPEATGLRISCADFTFPLLPPDKALALLQLLDFEAVDLGFFAGRSVIQPQDIVANPKAAAAEMIRKLKHHGLHASDVFLQTSADLVLDSANDPDPNVRKRVRHTFEGMLEFAAALGAGHMTGLPGVSHAGVSDEDSLKLAADEASWRTAAAKRLGVIYAVEPHLGSICADVPAVLRFLDHSEGVTLTLDYGHFIEKGIANEAVHCLLPFASHFHARGGCRGKLQGTVNENTIDFGAILKQFRANNYAGYICLEYVWLDWRGCDRTDNLSETILLREHLKKLAAQM